MSWASIRRVLVRRRWTGLGAGSARQRVMAASSAVTCSRRVRMGCAMVEVAIGVGCCWTVVGDLAAVGGVDFALAGADGVESGLPLKDIALFELLIVQHQMFYGSRWRCV